MKVSLDLNKDNSSLLKPVVFSGYLQFIFASY